MKKKYIIFPSILLCIVLVVFIVYFYTVRNKKPEEEIVEVTMRLQWHTQTQFAGYFVASQKGYYRDSGLKVNIEQGGYGENGLLTVKEGLEEFGIKAMADLVVSDTSLISLANIVKNRGLYLISNRDKGITGVEDFPGNRVSVWFIGIEYQLFALLDKYKIPKEEVQIISQHWDMSQFYNDEVDVAAVMVYNEYYKVLDAGYLVSNLNVLSFKELGVGFPGQNIFTSKSYYRDNPEICRKFVNASIKGWEYAVSHPEEASRIVMGFDFENILDYDHQLLQMNEMIKLIEPDKYKIGIHREEDYRFIERVFKEYDYIDENLNVEEGYTNDIIGE